LKNLLMVKDQQLTHQQDQISQLNSRLHKLESLLALSVQQSGSPSAAIGNNFAALSMAGGNPDLPTNAKQLEEHTLGFQNSNKPKMLAGGDEAFSQRMRQGQAHHGTMSFQDINTQTANFNRVASSNRFQQSSNQDNSDSQQPQ